MRSPRDKLSHPAALRPRPGEVHEMASIAGFDKVDVEAGPLPLRLPPPEFFFWQYVHSTPLAGIAAQLDAETRAALESHVRKRCEPFVDGDALVMEPRLLVATAHRS
jgi:hypothetical protein